jgi:hypothetical protein
MLSFDFVAAILFSKLLVEVILSVGQYYFPPMRLFICFGQMVGTLRITSITSIQVLLGKSFHPGIITSKMQVQCFSTLNEECPQGHCTS